MDTIAEAAKVDPEAELGGGADPAVEPAPAPGILERLMSAETGPGPISSYRDHAINFTGDDGGARLARGLTGLFDNINLAIVDLLVGAFQVFIGLRKTPVGGA